MFSIKGHPHGRKKPKKSPCRLYLHHFQIFRLNACTPSFLLIYSLPPSLIPRPLFTCSLFLIFHLRLSLQHLSFLLSTQIYAVYFMEKFSASVRDGGPGRKQNGSVVLFERVRGCAFLVGTSVLQAHPTTEVEALRGTFQNRLSRAAMASISYFCVPR